MEQQNNPPQSYYRPGGGSYQVPNSTAVLVLGILTIVCCWCYGIISMILGIVALVLANQGEREYKLHPEWYSDASYKNLKAGKTCAIIGLCLAGLAIVSAILYFVFFGTLFWQMFQQSQAW